MPDQGSKKSSSLALWLVGLCFALIISTGIMCSNTANAIPKEGDWICMAEPLDSQNTCDALDHDSDKETAKKKALALCMDKSEGCGADACQIVRCMRALKRK